MSNTVPFILKCKFKLCYYKREKKETDRQKDRETERVGHVKKLTLLKVEIYKRKWEEENCTL